MLSSRHGVCYWETRHLYYWNTLTNEQMRLPRTFFCSCPWIFCTRVRGWGSVICNLSTRGFLHWYPKQPSHHMQASFTGVLIMSGHNILEEYLSLIISYSVLWSYEECQMPPEIYYPHLLKNISSIVNYLMMWWCVLGLRTRNACSNYEAVWDRTDLLL